MSDATYTYRDTDAMVELQLAVYEVGEGVTRVIVALDAYDFGGDRVTAWLTFDDARRMADAIENGKPFEFTDPSGDVLTVEHGTLQTTISIASQAFIPDGEEPARVTIRLRGDAPVLLLAELRSLCGPEQVTPVNDALVKARDAVRAMFEQTVGERRPQWRVIFTDSESPTGVAPVCTAEGDDDLHLWADLGNGFSRVDDGVWDCCPSLQFETYSTVLAAYLVELLNADAEDGAQ
ncbi:hypothetical protein R2F25_30180 [Streptomyces sp. UP1A-1]|nr:hypothetical protein [Streptomyces sp. UP1A-1]